MKRPNWATVIGIIMIAFGGCNVLNDLQAIHLPAKLDEKRKSFHTTTDSLDAERADTIQFGEASRSKKSEKEIKIDFAKKALDMPEATKTWIVRFGYIGIFIAIVYILGGVFLLIPKNFSIMLAYGALILSIAFSAAKTLVLTSPGSSSGVIALTMGATQLFGILIDIVLLSVIFASEKEFYKA